MTKKTEDKLSQQVDAKVTRKLKAQGKTNRTIWSGLGMMGLIGWSVVVPTLLGAALGIWIDKNYPSSHSWTLALLMLGLTLGCANAWQWVDKEDQAMRKDHEARDD
jgi:ATP synthase protein I